MILALCMLPMVIAQRTQAAKPSFVLVPALAAGLIIGLYEAITLWKDLQVKVHRISHAGTAFAYALVATFIVFNVEFTLSLIPQLQNIPIISSVLGVRIIICVITAVRVHASSKIAKNTAGIQGTSETWFHTFFVAGLILAAPYVWKLLNPTLPAWLQM